VQKFSAALGWLHKFLNNQHTQPRAERKKEKLEKQNQNGNVRGVRFK